MRKIIIMLCLATTNSVGQNVLNAYNNSLIDQSKYNFINPTSSYQNNFIYSIPQGNGYYRGEFEIYFGRLPWYQLFIDPVVALGSNVNTTVPYVFSLSYFYEVVSFRFHINCACSNGTICEESDLDCSTHKRKLTLPVEDNSHFTYYSNLGYMQYVKQPTPLFSLTTRQ